MRIHSPWLLSTGFLIQLFIFACLYWLLPEVDFLGGPWTIYPPASALPEKLENSASFTNIELLIRLSVYPIGYTLLASILYLLAARWITLEPRLVALHFFLTMLGFTLLIPFNNDIILPRSGDSFYLSDIYVSGRLTPTLIGEMQNQSIVYNAILSPGSVIGIIALVSGSVIFLVNVFRNFRKK